MQKSDFSLKKLSIYERMSEETTAFNAELYYKGKLVSYVKNDGRGGSHQFDAFPPATRELLNEAEKWALAQPAHTWESHGEKHSLPYELDFLIDEFIDAELKKKSEKKIQKRCEKAILWGVPGGSTYTEIAYKVTIAQMMANPAWKLQLQNKVNEIKKELKPNEVFFNTNLNFA